MPPFAASSPVLALFFCSLPLLFTPLSFFWSFERKLPRSVINIAEVRLERPLSNETALARGWISLPAAFFALLIFRKQKC